MKTAAFITIHVGFNIGSKLQTIATFEVLKKIGLNPICVNYIPPRVTHRRYWETAIKSPMKFMWRVTYYPIHLVTERNFDGYLAKYCKMSAPICIEDDFISKCPKADIYVSGSDQLWNSIHNEGIDTHYFFDGIRGAKIAFASSIGMTYLPEKYARYMKKQLTDYKAISVRETSAVGILKRMGIESIQVLDPTFMLDKNEWIQFASKRIVKKNYLFVYLPYNIKDKDLVYQTVHKIAQKKKLTIVSYSDNIIKDKYADKTIYFVTPGDVLSLIMNAEVVVTNSFHGTAFSINLNKQFWTYMPSKFSTRITSLLDLCELNDRLLEHIISDCQIDEVINYNQTNTILQQERQKACHFLTKALQ